MLYYSISRRKQCISVTDAQYHLNKITFNLPATVLCQIFLLLDIAFESIAFLSNFVLMDIYQKVKKSDGGKNALERV